MPRHVSPIFTTDHDGAEIALVPLTRGWQAKLFRDDLARLQADGWPLRWTLNANGHRSMGYVRCARSRASGGIVRMARVITGAGAGEVVRYRDVNTLNLRRDNLAIGSGRAKRTDAAIPAAPPRGAAAAMGAA